MFLCGNGNGIFCGGQFAGLYSQRVNDLPAGGKLTLSAAEYHLAKAALNQLRTQRLAEGGYTDAVDDALTRLLHAHTPLFIW